MGTLIGGIIILGIIVIILYVLAAPMFSTIGKFIDKLFKPFKNREDDANESSSEE